MDSPRDPAANDHFNSLVPETPIDRRGFHADYRPSYRKAEAEDGWKRMLAWFKKNGVA